MVTGASTGPRKRFREMIVARSAARAGGMSRAPRERRRAAVPDSCARRLPASPKAPAALLNPHGLLALPMPPRNPTVCAPPPLSPPPAPARPARYPAPLTGSAARRFPGLRKRPERLQPRAAYPRHRRRARQRSMPPHAAASAAAPRAPHHNTASKNQGVGKSPAPPSARGPLQLCFSNTPPFEKFSNSYLIVGAAVVRAF